MDFEIICFGGVW